MNHAQHPALLRDVSLPAVSSQPSSCDTRFSRLKQSFTTTSSRKNPLQAKPERIEEEIEQVFHSHIQRISFISLFDPVQAKHKTHHDYKMSH